MIEKIKAEELMQVVPVELSPEDPAHWANSLMEDHDACHLPVTVNGQLLGMVSRRAALGAHLHRGSGYLVVLDFMKTHPIKVYPESTLRELTQALVAGRRDCLAVVSRRDEVLGTVHAHDVLRRLLRYQNMLDGRFQPARAA